MAVVGIGGIPQSPTRPVVVGVGGWVGQPHMCVPRPSPCTGNPSNGTGVEAPPPWRNMIGC